LRILESVAGVEEVVPHVFKSGTMERVASRFRDHVHNTARGASELRLCIVTGYYELLNQVDVGNHYVRRAPNICVNDSVEEIQLRAVLLPVKRGIRKTRTRKTHITFTTANRFVLRRRNG